MGKNLEKVTQVATVSLAIIGAMTLIVTVGLFMVGMEEFHPEAWRS